MNSNDHNAYEFDGIIHETPENGGAYTGFPFFHFPSGTAILTVSFPPSALAILSKVEMEGFAVPRSIFDMSD